jgi:pyruvate ferredoxin oxidoreductase gamma subunit
MFRIRLHGRGGQGMKTAGQILGSAFFAQGFQVQDAPRYGAERRGAPIFAYVRAAREPIRERGVIGRPDLVVVADETLIPMPAAAVLQGLTSRSVMLIRSWEPAKAWRERLALAGPVICLAPGPGAGPIGAQCAGAAARLAGAIARESLAAAIRVETGRYGASAVEANLGEALAAFDAMAENAGTVSEGLPIAAQDYAAPDWIGLPFESADLSTPEIRAGATSMLANTGLWRTLRPVIDTEHCNRCSWICSTLCPDSAIEVGPDRSPRIDLDHCKGCLICVAVCPPHAIRAVPESEARAAEATP